MNSKRRSKRKIILMVVIGFTVLLLTAIWSAVADTAADNGESIEPWIGWSIEGAWIVRALTPTGSVVHLLTADAQDPECVRYTAILKHSQCSPTVLGMFAEAESQSDSVGQLIKTGPDSTQFTLMNHATKPGDLALGGWAEMVYFTVMSGTGKLSDQNNIEGEATIAYYLPEQDADGDGLPDEGQEPALCAPYMYTCKRIQLMSPCEPTPVPEGQ